MVNPPNPEGVGLIGGMAEKATKDIAAYMKSHGETPEFNLTSEQTEKTLSSATHATLHQKRSASTDETPDADNSLGHQDKKQAWAPIDVKHK